MGFALRTYEVVVQIPIKDFLDTVGHQTHSNSTCSETVLSSLTFLELYSQVLKNRYFINLFSAGVYRRSIFEIRPNILIGLQKLRLRPKDRSRSRLFIIFAVSRTGTVGSTKHWVTVPKCLHKTPKSIKNSAKVHLNPLKTDENFM